MLQDKRVIEKLTLWFNCLLQTEDMQKYVKKFRTKLISKFGKDKNEQGNFKSLSIGSLMTIQPNSTQ